MIRFRVGVRYSGVRVFRILQCGVWAGTAMSETKRLFVAILLPEEIRDAVKQVQTRLRGVIGREGVRWTLPEQFHFTLKFLGDVENSQLPAIIAGVEQASARSAEWTLEVGHIGVFPKQRNPQVLWVGATVGVPVMTADWRSISMRSWQTGICGGNKALHPTYHPGPHENAGGRGNGRQEPAHAAKRTANCANRWARFRCRSAS